MGNKALDSIWQDTVERGAKYWDKFEWDQLIGPKPEFERMVYDIALGTTIMKHPVQEGYV